jgi:hypothetical protein
MSFLIQSDTAKKKKKQSDTAKGQRLPDSGKLGAVCLESQKEKFNFNLPCEKFMFNAKMRTLSCFTT